MNGGIIALFGVCSILFFLPFKKTEKRVTLVAVVDRREAFHGKGLCLVFYGAVGKKGRRKVSDVLAFLREIFTISVFC